MNGLTPLRKSGEPTTVSTPYGNVTADARGIYWVSGAVASSLLQQQGWSIDNEVSRQ